MRLALIRHGEPLASLERVVAGPRGCRGLSELGRTQAEALRDRLIATRELRPDVVLTSVLPRAVQTATVLSPALGDATQDCDLCELHPGECDGASWDDYAGAYPSWDAPDRIFSPGGESLVSFDLRVRAALERLSRDHAGRSVVIVGHSGFIESASLALMGGPGFPERRSFVINALRYTSITEWTRLEDGRWLLERYNDAGHLAGIPLSSPDAAFR